MGRRKRSSKHRLKPGKLLSPLVQQFRNVTTKSSESSRSSEYIFSLSYITGREKEGPPLILVCLCSGAATGTGEHTLSLNGSPAKGSFPTHSRTRSCTSHLPSSTSGPVQTQQPCSLKGSLSSDDIYAGLRGDSSGTHAYPGQGKHTTAEQNTDCKHWEAPKNQYKTPVIMCIFFVGFINVLIPDPGVLFPFWYYFFTGWSNYPQTSERVTYKSSSKPRARFLSGPVSLSICLYLLSSGITSLVFLFYFCAFSGFVSLVLPVLQCCWVALSFASSHCLTWCFLFFFYGTKIAYSNRWTVTLSKSNKFPK